MSIVFSSDLPFTAYNEIVYYLIYIMKKVFLAVSLTLILTSVAYGASMQTLVQQIQNTSSNLPSAPLGMSQK